jgi:hypothetical protein
MTKIVPIIIGGLGTIKKGLDHNFQLLPGHLSAIELQKLTPMNTTHIIRKVLGLITYFLLRPGLTRRPPPSKQ